MTLKYKVGDRVKVKSLDWYNKNKDEFDEVPCKGYTFVKSMVMYCGKILTIEKKTGYGYYVKENPFNWTDEMIEGLAEEEVGLVDNLSSRWVNEFSLPDGYQFKDENGNVINATKIVLEKKKKYPKTYEECCKVMNYCCNPAAVKTTHKEELIRRFQFLLLYRDAYWKIAGDEMGLGKPWEPDWENNDHESYPAIVACGGKIIKSSIYTHDNPFVFPTPEMRDAFKENFDPDIEFCKELL